MPLEFWKLGITCILAILINVSNWKYCANGKVQFNLFYSLNESDKQLLTLPFGFAAAQWEDMQNFLLMFGVKSLDIDIDVAIASCQVHAGNIRFLSDIQSYSNSLS